MFKSPQQRRLQSRLLELTSLLQRQTLTRASMSRNSQTSKSNDEIFLSQLREVNFHVLFSSWISIESKKKFLLLLLIFKILEKGFFLNILFYWFRFLLHWTKRDRQNQANIYFSQSFVAITTSSGEIQTLTGNKVEKTTILESESKQRMRRVGFLTPTLQN